MKGKKPAASKFSLRDGGIFTGWIAGLLIAGGLAWFFTQPVRARILMESVNAVLAEAGAAGRLRAYIPEAAPGVWYTRADSGGRGVVFSVMDHGIMAAYAAMLSGDGKLESLIPLNVHGEELLERLPPAYFRPYLRRIETGGGR
jgi:hypothetical protein